MVEEKTEVERQEEEIPEEELGAEKCKIALGSALKVVLEECGGKDNFFKNIGKILGLSEEEVEEMNPLSEHCRRVLDEALTKERCHDFREQRRWVMCRAWDLMETEHIPFHDAIKRAWDELKERCAKIGAYI